MTGKNRPFAIEFSAAPKPVTEVSLSEAAVVAPLSEDIAPAAAVPSIDLNGALLMKNVREDRVASTADEQKLVFRSTKPKPVIAQWTRKVERLEDKLAVEQLLDTDESWLQPLALEPLAEGWIDDSVRQLVELGSRNLREAGAANYRDDVIAARYEFWELLGWADKRSPLSKPFNSYAKKWPNLRPTGLIVANLRTVAHITTPEITKEILLKDTSTLGETAGHTWEIAQRVEARGAKARDAFKGYPALKRMAYDTFDTRWNALDEHGFDTATLLKGQFRVLDLKPEMVKEVVEDMSVRFGSERALQELTERPNVFVRARNNDNPLKQRRRLATISKAIDILGLENVDPHKIMRSYNGVMNMGTANLFAHMKIFAKFGDRDITTAQFGQILTQSLENHLLNLGEEGRRYTPWLVKQIGKTMTKDEKRERTQLLIADAQYQARVGKPIIGAYQKYLADEQRRMSSNEAEV